MKKNVINTSKVKLRVGDTVILDIKNKEERIDKQIVNMIKDAKRRLYDLKQKGIDTTFDEVLEDIKKRDYNDINKPISPLVKTEDAVLIDTTNMTKEEVIDEVIVLLKERNVI